MHETNKTLGSCNTSTGTVVWWFTILFILCLILRVLNTFGGRVFFSFDFIVRMWCVHFFVVQSQVKIYSCARFFFLNRLDRISSSCFHLFENRIIVCAFISLVSRWPIVQSNFKWRNRIRNATVFTVLCWVESPFLPVLFEGLSLSPLVPFRRDVFSVLLRAFSIPRHVFYVPSLDADLNREQITSQFTKIHHQVIFQTSNSFIEIVFLCSARQCGGVGLRDGLLEGVR